MNAQIPAPAQCLVLFKTLTFLLKTSHLKSCMTVPLPVSWRKWVERLKHTCVCSIFHSPLSFLLSCPLFQYVMKLPEIPPSFTHLSFMYSMFHLLSFLPSIFSSLTSFSLVSVASHAANSSSLILSSFFTSALHLYFSVRQPPLLFLASVFSFTVCHLCTTLVLSSFPSLYLCVTGHAVNNKGKQVDAAHHVDSHGTLSLSDSLLSSTDTDVTNTQSLPPPVHGLHFYQ